MIKRPFSAKRRSAAKALSHWRLQDMALTGLDVADDMDGEGDGEEDPNDMDQNEEEIVEAVAADKSSMEVSVTLTGEGQHVRTV